MAFNGSSASSGRWIYPDLWHTFTVTVPPFEETIQFVMVDTETLTSEQNQFPGWANMPNLYYPPPPANYGRRRMLAAGEGVGAQAAAGAQALGGRAGGARRLADFDVHTAPPISQEQWAWAERTLSNSSADWLVVIGNDPVWSVGEHGPTWALAEKLLPLMESAGVALYISGRDPIAQHLMPSPSGASVDFVGIGNGAQSNASQALELPSQALCPDGALAFAYGASTGFVMVEVSSPKGKGMSQLSVSFYDDTGALLYNFSKPNPRAGTQRWQGCALPCVRLTRAARRQGLRRVGQLWAAHAAHHGRALCRRGHHPVRSRGQLIPAQDRGQALVRIRREGGGGAGAGAKGRVRDHPAGPHSPCAARRLRNLRSSVESVVMSMPWCSRDTHNHCLVLALSTRTVGQDRSAIKSRGSRTTPPSVGRRLAPLLAP